MQLEHLRDELCSFSLEQLQPFFEEIIEQKRREQKEKIQYENNLNVLINLLKSVCMAAEHKKKQWALFSLIGCETEELSVSTIVDNLSVAQLLDSINISFSLSKRTPIEETREYQDELKAAALRVGAVAYSSEYQGVLKERMERYYAELNRYYLKFGKRISEPQFFRIIVNGLKIKEIIPLCKTKNDIMNDITRIVNT